jgi:4-aminobutyrate aminotransferase/(S)-3-amino-2-methylpropionate transaminase
VIFIDFPNEGDKFDLTKLPPKEQIAAFVLETYQGWSAGMYPDQYIKDLYTFAREIGALVCFDEIQAGFYRMGSLYGYMTYGDFIEPDLISLGKGISSSLPIAAILGKKEIIDVPNGAAIGGTHVRNCLCCAAAKANLEFLTDEGFQNELKSKCKLFENSNKELESLKAVKKVNTKGMVSAIIFDSEEIATDVVRKCIMNGVLPVYTYKNSIKLGPPLTIQEDAIIEALEVIKAAIREVTE